MHIKAFKNGPLISHLFFVDDCLLFAQAKSNQVHLIKEELDAFCLASGLKVNIQKFKFNVSSNIHKVKIDKFH